MKAWRECIQHGEVFRIQVDPDKARGLQETAINRLNFLESLEVKTDSVNFLFEGYYASLIEVVHALAIFQGYKIMNHECSGAFVREYFQDAQLHNIFDKCRINATHLCITEK